MQVKNKVNTTYRALVTMNHLVCKELTRGRAWPMRGNQ